MTTKTTRRAVLAGAASVPDLSILPAAALSSPAADPIFAAIERQMRLWAEWDHTTHPEPPMRSANYAAWAKWNKAAADAYNDALEALVAIKPTTRAGAAALIRHCLAESSCRFPSVEEAGLANALLQTLEKAMPALA